MTGPRLSSASTGRGRRPAFQVPTGEWLNVLTGQRISSEHVALSELWRGFPVALLERGTL